MQWLLTYFRNTLPLRFLLFFLTAVTLAGCAPGGVLKLPPGEATLKKIEAGMSEKVVILLAGKPDRTQRYDDTTTIIYYRNGVLSDCGKNLSSCTPIAIESGRVAAIGNQWLTAWKKEHEAERRKKAAHEAPPALPAKPAVSAVEPPPSPPSTDKPLILTVQDDSKQSEEARKAEIDRLEAQVRHIPMSRTLDNLKIYRYLLKLAPDNKRYQRKVGFYEGRFEKEKAIRARMQIEALERQRRQNVILQKYEGNASIQMALKNLGNGMFHVWLKSTAKAPFHVMASDFTLECRNRRIHNVYQSRDFDVNILPDSTLEGRITFDTYCDPRAIHFSNKAVGRIFRRFPKIDLSKESTAPAPKKTSDKEPTPKTPAKAPAKP